MAGTGLTILKPTIRFAPRGTPVPPANLGYGAPWPEPWKRFQNLDDGITVDFNAPKVAINTSDNGLIATLPSGEDAIRLSTSTKTPDWSLLRKMTYMVESVAAAVEAGVDTEGRPMITSGYFDPNTPQNFMVGIEGFADEGGLFDTDHIVRFFAYNVDPAEVESGGGRGGGRGGGGGGGGRGGGGGGRGGGGEAQPGQIKFDHGGEDGLVQVALQLSALPEPNIADVFAGSDYPENLIDPRGKANWFSFQVSAA